MNKEELFNRLVENALDFLFKAISEIQDQPKYSVIHFYAAVELFVKARLMSEHWSLVIARKQDPDWGKFISGDFQSVSLDEAATKLKKIVRSGLSKAELDGFKEVAKHRNKMVHFFHVATTEEESKKFKHNIVKQQLRAWYLLHQLLTSKWSKEFSAWQDRIAELDVKLRELHEFLQVVFDNVKPGIDEKKKKGLLFEVCPSCRFEAQEHIESTKIIYESTCLVCGLNERSLKIECPECGKIVILREEGFGSCASCSKDVEPDDVADILIDEAAAYVAKTDGDDSYDYGNCDHCDGYHTVVHTESGGWACASCFNVFETIGCCSWCNDPNTGDMEHSYAAGCNHCEGMIGWHKDD